MIKYLASLFVLLALLTFGCKGGSSDSPKLAEVNGEVLYLDSFKASLSEDGWENLSPEQKRRYIEDWVNLTLLAQAADEMKLDQDPAVKERMAYAKKKVKANALIPQRLHQTRISEDQLFSYFRIHQADFQRPLLAYQIQRIALPDKLSAENVFQQINQGLDFAQAVRRYSTEDLRSKNGTMGFVEPDSADSLFWKAATELDIMEADVLSQNGAWYVFRYTETKDSEYEPSYEDHRAEIKSRIIKEKQNEIYQELLREIKSQNKQIYYY
ncbi:MAG: peptidylprolyl isomerase [Candidatus Cloacimonetes bacterium]|nr:peptidylprolyl isomerase [Candidatus Cloacimonadota bacterium]